MIKKLAELLAMSTRGRAAEEAAANQASKDIDAEIEAAKVALGILEAQRDKIRAPLEWQIKETDKTIERQKQKILDAWDGEKKTIVCPAGTLKFRTTQSLKIQDATLILTGLLDHTSVKDVVSNYIKGFNLTAVKKYMGVLDLPMGAAEIEQKTTVRLEVTP